MQEENGRAYPQQSINSWLLLEEVMSAVMDPVMAVQATDICGIIHGNEGSAVVIVMSCDAASYSLLM